MITTNTVVMGVKMKTIENIIRKAILPVALVGIIGCSPKEPRMEYAEERKYDYVHIRDETGWTNILLYDTNQDGHIEEILEVDKTPLGGHDPETYFRKAEIDTTRFRHYVKAGHDPIITITGQKPKAFDERYHSVLDTVYNRIQNTRNALGFKRL